jgi:TetR/AcrR family transcriptional regulator
MNPRTDKKRNDQGSRVRLIEAAVKLFAEKGYANTSVREIVELAGVTKPVLYYYFKSKEGMFRQILDYAAKQEEEMLSEVLETPGPVLERLIHLYRLAYRVLNEDRNLFKVIHNLIFSPNTETEHLDLGKYHRRMIDVIKSIYLEGLAKGEVKEASPDEVAFLVTGLFDFCIHLDYTQPQRCDPGRPERLLRMAFFGLNGINYPHQQEVQTT